jgi:hypothetical protein
MQYALLIYEPDEHFAGRENATDDGPYVGAWRAYHKAVVEAGIYVGGNPLEGPDTATTVRQRDGQRHVQDGPHASSKEQLGGMMLLELPSLDAALEWAARCPAASYGLVEVRPVASAMHRRIVE